MRADRINALGRITRAKSYLEIGVFHGHTFFEVDIPFKVGVDPTFQFDHRRHANRSTQLHPVSSDRFFAEAAATPFDIIYLDGLHTYEQTTRDFFNSMKLAHDKTIWVLDDTVPNDVFSADPDQDRCYRLRRKLGNDDWSWMGDVYKTVFFINQMLPAFQFRTFNGHGQTVVWKGKRVRELANSTVGLGRISNMTYDDLIEHLDVMQVDTDQNIYDAIAQALA